MENEGKWENGMDFQLRARDATCLKLALGISSG